MASTGTSTGSPSPTGPLLILGLVLLMWIAPSYFTQEPPSVLLKAADTSESFSLAPLLLVVPVVLIIVLQLMSTSGEVVNSTLLDFSISKSTFILSGLVVLVLGLIWLQATIHSALVA
ncbi:hypothetical protein O6H91_14G030100 [Diphasiastrum complanatum]|uniref:Uncharacterized protein n=1 Tax=Diphasiastrum complanatum TaxID=34168 RepID=A0ACC2BMQ0_DIPCM|nr:hypothetical protein O6H91_14G030100 [Diphasiastrum complanatum]